MSIRPAIFLILTAACLIDPVPAVAEDSPLAGIQVTKYAPARGSFPGCTQIAFHNKTEVVTTGDELFFRTNDSSPFRESPITGLKDAHAVVFNNHDQLFYITDTGNHGLKTAVDVDQSQFSGQVETLAEIKLHRPHDIVLDEASGWLYSINPNDGYVFRFRNFDDTAKVLDLSKHLGYSRALSVVKGRLYVIGSSVGAAIEVVDFAKAEYTVHDSFGKKKDAVAGSWKSTGLVLNDVDYFKGHWYATSYFCPSYAAGEDCNEHKFIRFKAWQDLKDGSWEDLSILLPGDLVPYYLTPRDNALYIAVFDHETPNTGGAIHRLTVSDAAD